MARPQPQIPEFYRALMGAWGPQDWWPAHTRFEVIVGAFLTQNTAWSNVEKGLRNLRRAGGLSLEGIRRVPRGKLEQLIRPAGYFRQKARRLKSFVRFLDRRYRGSLTRMFARPTAALRAELLELHGVGPETADSILLYAGGHPVFVVDAYTCRILERHGLVSPGAKYEEIRELFEQAIDERAAGSIQPAGTPADPLPGRKRHKYRVASAGPRARVFDEYHALIVQAAKRHCLKPTPKCEGCPLQPYLAGPVPVPPRPGRRGRGRPRSAIQGR